MDSKLKKFFFTAFFRGLGALSILILYYTITRFYPAHDAAHVFFMLTSAGITTPLMLTGLNTFSVKKIPILDQTAASSDNFMASVLWTVAKNGAAASILMLAVGAILWATDFHPEFFSPAVFALFFAIPTFSIIGFFFQGKRFYNISIFILNICNFLLLALAIAIYGLARGQASSPYDADALFLLTSLSTLGIALLLLFRFLKISPSAAMHHRKSFSLSASDQKERLNFWIILVLIYTSNWLPQLAYYFSGARADYSYFTIAERLSNVINFFVIISNFFLAPIASQLFASGKLDELRAYFIRITRLIVLTALPFAAVLIFFPAFVLGFFGHDYRGGAIYLVIMASTQLFNVVVGSVNTLLGMTGSERIVLYSTAVAIMLELICILVLGPLWGGIGFAIAYAVNIVVQNGTVAWFANKRLGANVLLIFSLRHL